MTVSSTTNRKSFTGDGVTTSFGTSPVVFFNSSELVVQVIVTATGAATTLVENTNYTVSGGSGSTGTVNLAGGTSPNGAPSASQTLLIRRVLPLTQTDDFVNNDINDAEVTEDRFDKTVMQIQQLDEELGRGLVIPASETATDALTVLPFDRASQYLAFDASKNPIASPGPAGDNVPVSTFMATVLDDLTAADARTTLGAAADAAFRKNIIIGGNFSTNPFQRGRTFTSIANGAYCADRFVFGNTSAAVLDCFGVGDSPTAAEAGVYSTTCLELDVTTADATLAAGDLCFIGQYIEGLNISHMGFGQSGTRYMTLSFWHKHTKTGTHCVALRNSATNRSYVAEYTQAVSNTWEKATITFAVDTSGTWLYDTGVGLRLNFALAAGTTYQTTAGSWQAGNYLCTANQVNNLDSTSNDFKIALVQLEAGTVATEFENLDAADVEQLCERYCYIFKGYAAASHVLGINHAIGASTSVGYLKFPTTMRGAPTLTVSDPSHFETLRANGSAADACTGITINGTSTPFGAGLLVESANLVAGDASRFSAVSASSRLTFSAEL